MARRGAPPAGRRSEEGGQDDIPIRLAAGLAAIAVPAAPAKATHHHHRGCNTAKCDEWVDHEWWKKDHPRPRVTGSKALASWYDDAGSLACSRARDGMGVASLIVSCGTQVRLCHDRCVVATVDDHGPYIGGRSFDLNAAVKSATGCPDLCKVRWSVVR